MKKGKKLISFLLAFTLIVTAVPGNGAVSAPEVKAAQTKATQTKAAESSGLVKWAPVDNDDDTVKVNDDQTEKETVVEYGGDFSFYYTGTLQAVTPYGQDFEVNEERVWAVIESGDVETGDVEARDIEDVTVDDFSYQWYEVDADGNRTELEGQIDTMLEIVNPLYADGEDICVTNAEKEKTFVCVLTLDRIKVNGTYRPVSDDEALVASGDLSIEHKYTLRYTGNVVEKSQISDYFSGVEDLEDKMTVERNIYDYYYHDEYDRMNVSEISREDWDSYFNYRWTAYYMDGSDEEVDRGIHERSIPGKYVSLFNQDGKQIDYYECEIDLCYGYQVIDTVSKKFCYRYEPFHLDGDAEVTQHIRKNATVKMDAEAQIDDTEAIDKLAYQWYLIDSDGKETKLENETAATYTVRVPNPSVSYRVEVTAQKQKAFEGPVFEEVLTRTFRFTPAEGYLLKDISLSSYRIKIGDTQKLYVEPRVDDGYTLEYQWEKVSYEKDEEGNYVFDENYNRKIVSDVVGESNEYEVKPTDVGDFETIWDWAYDGENYQDEYNYRVTVKVKKDDEVVDTHVYTFKIDEDIDCNVVEKSKPHLSLDPGDDLELYVKVAPKDCYTLKQTWYKKVAEGIAAEKASVETDGVEYISADEDFEIPEKYDRAEQGDYEGYYEIEDEYVPCYRYTFWEKVGAGDTYTKNGMDSGEVVDVRGEYQCRLELYRAGEEDADDEEVAELFLSDATETFTVSYDSDLSAYAKSRFPVVKEGETAKLRVVAQTKSDVYKIHYKWEKLGTDNEYEEIEDNDGPVYEIKKVTSEDAGWYRVTVTDEYDSRTCSPIDIVLSVQNGESTKVTHVCYTPDQSTYKLRMGQKVNLKLDMKLSDPDVDVFYAWYRREAYKTGWGWDSYEENWELIGEDKNTYGLEVKSKEDITTYKCIAVYRKNATEYEEKEVTFNVREAYSAELERMTPADQLKRCGDSASYTVRLITDDPKQSVNYQWYREDGTEISGATKETYEVAELKKDDFGRIYCVATDSKTGEEVADRVSFTTRIYRNGAYLEKNNETVEASISDAETVLGAPVIARGEGLELTYQWYRNADSESYWYDNSTIIYGATASTYTIEEIGDNEFGKYRCEIFADGFFLADYYTTVVEKVEDQEDQITVRVSEGYETNVKAFLGGSAKFAVTAESKKGLALRYQWYYYNSYEGTHDAIGGATESTYEIATVTSLKKGYYRCIVMDEEGNTAASELFFLTTTTGLDVETEGYDPSDAIGVQTSFGAQDVVLTATATAEHGYTPFYQWYHETINENGLIYGANSQVLTLSTIDEDALGMYYCVVTDSFGAVYTLKYYVYVNNGLNVVPSTYNVLVGADGSVKMYVKATANAGCEISYQWSKYGKDENDNYGYIDIEGATQSTFVLSQLKRADYGTYRCKISTIGERNYYNFSIRPSYIVSADRDFAGQGDRVTAKVELENPASDGVYSYQWYEREPATGTYRKIKNGTDATLTKTVPAVDLSEQFTGNNKLGYVSVDYRCVITIGEGEDAEKEIRTTSVKVLPDLEYRSDAYPETNHPNDKSFDLQAYRVDGAKQLKITFDAKTQLGSASLYLIDKEGNFVSYSGGSETVTISGDSVVFLMNGNDKADSYGYKVLNIEAVYSSQLPDSTPSSAPGSTPSSAPGSTPSSAPGSTPSSAPGSAPDSTPSNAPDSTPDSTPSSAPDSTPDSTPSSAPDSAPSSTPGSAPSSAPGSTQGSTPGSGNTVMGDDGKAGSADTVKKGSKYTVKNVNYKVTSVSEKSKTVTVTGGKSKKLTRVTIPATVKIAGVNYKVTEISPKAFQGYNKLKSVTIGKNVKKIGANAFAKDKKLKKLTVKGTALKSIGKKAFANVPKKATVTVPTKSKKAYKKLFKKGAFKGKVK